MQEEHASATILETVSWIRELCSLHLAPAKGKNSDNQPSSSYCFLMGDIFSDILGNIDDHISSPSSGIRFKKVLSCFHILGVRSRRYYSIEGKEVVCYRTLSRAISEHRAMKSFENLNKTDIVFFLSEVEDLEGAARTLQEVTSWMDWWTYAAKFLALRNNCNTSKVKHLFVADLYLEKRKCDKVTSCSFKNTHPLPLLRLSGCTL